MQRTSIPKPKYDCSLRATRLLVLIGNPKVVGVDLSAIQPSLSVRDQRRCANSLGLPRIYV